MGRARLMEQQRAKVLARRTAKKVKAAAAAKPAAKKPTAAAAKPAAKKPAAKPAPKPTVKKPVAKPSPKPAAKPSPKPTATSSRPKQTVNGASLGSRLTPEERKRRLAEMAKTGSATQGSNMPSNPSLKVQPKKTTYKGASSSRKSGSNASTTNKPTKRTRSRRENRRSRG